MLRIKFSYLKSMLSAVSFLLLSLLSVTVIAEQYQCRNEYRSSEYVGKTRIPTNCNLEKLDCPRSWKSGIPKGAETDSPLVYQNFFKCHEGFTACGYVPINARNGEVLGKSGVTIGGGVDLGSKTKSTFSSVKLPRTLLDKLEPYFGLKRKLAACAVIERALVLTLTEANQLTDAIADDIVKKASKKYDADKSKDAKPFVSLPRGIRTAIVSVWYQFGHPSYHPAYPRFWGLVTRNDWDGAVKELRNFYTNPEDQQKGDLRRRNNEADIIEATLQKCNRSVDLVFLIDESGSVSAKSFNESLEFVINFIQAFPDEKLEGDNGTRFGLSTFSSDYQSHFYLSNYKSQSSYLAAVSRVKKKGGGTYLGAALRKILFDQFTKYRGLRPEKNGLPRILIVLTDGRASDRVELPAQNVQDQNIVIYAIGIGGYDLNQLNGIASSKSHVYTLSTFDELEKFIATLTSSACYEPRPVSLGTEIQTTVLSDAFQYFSFDVSLSLNLEIEVNDLAGSTFAFASRSNPQPYEYDNDVSFFLSRQKNKRIVISPKTRSGLSKRAAGNERAEIYVSVTAGTKSALFTIEGNECSPVNCTEGTNEMSNHAVSTFKFSSVYFALKFVVVSLGLFMTIY